MATKLDESTQVDIYKNALNDCIIECKKIDSIYDVLLRGTACDFNNIVPYWSDIDLTIILETMCHDTILKIQTLYSLLQKKYHFKISLTLITLEDYLNNNHHHGMKPLYYNQILNDAISMFDKTYPMKQIEDNKLTRYDCYLNLIYLIHDLRKRLLTLDPSKKEAKVAFTIHLLKRSKHLVRNSIFLCSGYIDEDINLSLSTQYFPMVDPLYFDFLQTIKASFFENLERNLDKVIEYVFNETEKVFAETLRYVSS